MGHQSRNRYEAALRRLPDAHSLALRLQQAGVADEVVCSYLHIEPEGLDTLLMLAREKLAAQLVEIEREESAVRHTSGSDDIRENRS